MKAKHSLQDVGNNSISKYRKI